MNGDYPFHVSQWPELVRAPEDLKGEPEALSMSWDLGDVSEADKKRITKSWVQRLPTLPNQWRAMMRCFVFLFAGRCIALAVGGLFLLSCAVAQTSESTPDGDAWPAHVVTLEQMRPLTPYKLKVRGLVAKGRVTGPAVLRVHVGVDGKVVRVSLLNSSGNPDLDEASLHAMRPMAFKPFLSDGAAIEVSMLVPVHVPARLGRSE